MPEPGDRPDPAAIRRALAGTLPGHMVPAALVPLDALPLTPSGKLDRRALPAPSADPLPARRAPRTPREELLCDLIAGVLDVAAVGVDDDFFSLGGHSLLAVRLISKIRKTLGADLPLRAVFDAPTAAELAGRLASAGTAGTQRPPLRPAARQAPIPVSFAQRRLWFLNRLDPSSAAHNLPLAVRLSGPLDRAALHDALADLVARHESLRTVFPEVGGAPCQKIVEAAGARPDLPVVHLGEAELDEGVASAAAEGFDLVSEPPLRARLFALSSSEHVLVVTLHHIAADGWSLGPLVRDIATAYAARAAGHVPDWQPLPVQYADYTLWQRDVLGGENDSGAVMAGQLAYWRERLAGAPDELPLPADRPRPARSSHRAGEVSVDIAPELHGRLLALARSRDATPFMVLQAALAALLARVGGGDDIVIGSPIAGRGHEAVEDLVGFFVNTLVLRVDTGGDPTFAELLGRVRETALDAYDHADVPFERLVEAVNPPRSLGRHPLFQVLLTVRNAAESDLPATGGGIRMRPVPAGRPWAKFDLEFGAAVRTAPDGGAAGIRMSIIYATDLFDRRSAEALLVRLRALVRAVTADPEVPVGRIDLLSDAERAHLRPAAGPEAAPRTFPDLFQAQVARTPNRPALISTTGTYTYRELDRRANRLAHHLIARRVGPERTVALVLPRGAEQVVATLAVLKAGGAFLPVDPEYPQERIRVMLDDARPDMIITSRSLGRPPRETAPILLLDDALDEVAEDEKVPEDLTPDRRPTDADRIAPLRTGHPAYVIYTSGSTGSPNGVVVTHAGVANLAAAQIDRFAVTPDSRVLAFASPSFDAAFSELCTALSSGAALVAVPADRLRPGPPLAGLLAEFKVTHVTLPPAALPTLPADALRTVRTLAVAGEAVSAEAVARWSPGRRMINAYGPTETTVCATMSGPLAAGNASMGVPLSGMGAYVLDRALRPVPPGTVGELYVSGPGLARGYLGRPALTAGCFVPDPFGPPGERMYRTGDLVRRDRHGNLHFAGRADQQIKLRGLRIEPGEIESALRRHPDVEAAVVTLDRSSATGPALVAHVVPSRGGVDPGELRRHLAARLPEYMVPALLVPLDRLPLTPSGKVDRRALPSPAPRVEAGRAPRDPREEALCALFAELFEMPSVGADADFFDLGGHSLLVPALADRIHRTLGVDVGVRGVFEARTPAGLARLVDAGTPGGDLDVVFPLRTDGTRPPLFCVAPAVGLAWSYAELLQYLEPDQPVYGLQSPGLDGAADPPESIAEIAAIHTERMRTVRGEGPYHLLGWSVGGLIAFAVAERLQAEGEEVATLTLLDAYPPVRLPALAVPQDRGELAEAVRRETHGALDGRDHLLDTLTRVYRGNVRAAREFAPGRFRGTLLHFAAGGGRNGDLPGADAWSPYVTGRLERHLVDCAHHEMTRPGPLARIAAVLAARMSDRRTRESG